MKINIHAKNYEDCFFRSGYNRVMHICITPPTKIGVSEPPSKIGLILRFRFTARFLLEQQVCVKNRCVPCIVGCATVVVGAEVVELPETRS